MSAERKAQFVRWLVKAWEFAEETQRPIATALAELIAHSDEPDFPLWSQARAKGVIGDSRIAKVLRTRCGMPHETPEPTDWERQINFSPVIALDEKLWRDMYDRLGWANRDIDPSYPGRNFWLWSAGGNIVRFIARPKAGPDGQE
jgi:hypothetical protein